ncbi:MAG TPA: glycosyl hydrolase family 28 protein [Polyangiaceae bacterium]|nr:glycosyl hydrolase family 28 protein [Polyangiaceae bacterium]
MRPHAWIATLTLGACACDSASGPGTLINANSNLLVCGFAPAGPPAGAGAGCGAGDPKLPPEPTLPTDVCQTLVADKATPDESQLDTMRIQAALTACKGQGAVKLTSSGANNAFVAGHLSIDSTILWIDAGTTLYASRNPFYYQSVDGNCGLTGISDSNACAPLMTVTGTSPGIVGDGVIDGQGQEPLVGQDYSWWDLSNALRASNGSGPNPALIEVKAATGFLLYRITLHNSPKFHVKISATPAAGDCSVPGSGFTVWGITLLTPSKLNNSRGFPLTPFYARNTDGVDPGAFAATSCGVIACNTISTGDDQIALKGAHSLSDIVIAHNHFGSGHGMSIGSETNGGVSNIEVYDLTIDADTRYVGAPSSDTSDFNGLRVKSDESRGGPVSGVVFHDICVRDALNPIVVDSSYNPLFGGNLVPDFQDITIRDFHAVTCASLSPPIVDIQGFNAQYPIGSLRLDNVIVDGITPLDIAAQYANVTLGPGPVNFTPSGTSVSVTSDVVAGAGAALPCAFPPLPVAE